MYGEYDELKGADERIKALLTGEKVRHFTINNVKEWPKYQEHMHSLLLSNIKAHLPMIKKLSNELNGHATEDSIYRFYHHSFKVYYLQVHTEKIVEVLKAISPEGVEFCKLFSTIIREGTGKHFSNAGKGNKERRKRTGPIVEAFFHARYMLDMAAKFGEELQEAPSPLPSGWAALLSLYGIR
jgi:hypothetical protein